MSIGKFIVDGVIRNLLPVSGLVFPVAVGGLVKACLADVVEQGADRDALQIVLALHKVLAQERAVDIQTVLRQSAGVGGVKARRCRGIEKVGGLEPVEQTISAAAGYIGLKRLNKLCFAFFFFHVKSPPYIRHPPVHDGFRREKSVCRRLQPARSADRRRRTERKKDVPESGGHPAHSASSSCR